MWCLQAPQPLLAPASSATLHHEAAIHMAVRSWTWPGSVLGDPAAARCEIHVYILCPEKFNLQSPGRALVDVRACALHELEPPSASMHRPHLVMRQGGSITSRLAAICSGSGISEWRSHCW